MHAIAVIVLGVVVGMVRGKESASGRTVMLWFDGGSTNATWTSWYNALAAHRENVTAVSPCIYLLGEDGGFGLQVSESIAEMSFAWSKAVVGLGLEVLPLIAGNPTGVIHQMVPNMTARSAFIAESVREAELRGYKGYNLDAEGPVKDAETGQKYVEFLNEWADALHAKGMVLSVEIAGVCRGADFFGASCRMFREESRVDRVVTMATYEGYRPKWLEFLVDAWAGLGSLLGAGMESSELEHSPYPAQKVADIGVQEIDFWVNLPPSQTAWDNIGIFLHANTHSAEKTREKEGEETGKGGE